MVENSFPKCPICKEEVLLPFSVSQLETTKTFAHWVCTNCGFCIGTADSRGCNPDKDVEAGFLSQLIKKMDELKEIYRKQG